MTATSPVKTEGEQRCQIVGVIATPADLEMALVMPDPPDLFELRLDHFASAQDELAAKVPGLSRPLILTARHPAEGGANNLPNARRRELLSRFLPSARYVDVELRAAEAFHSLLLSLPGLNVERILSLHDFESTPTPRSLHAKARTAKSLGASIFKVATRTDTPAQFARLLEFIARDDIGIAVSVMGMGNFGSIARVVMARCGSVMAYAAMADRQVEGQLAVPELREAFRLLGLD